MYSPHPESGFLPEIDPLRTLPAGFEPWDDIAAQLPELIRSRRLRAALTSMPLIDSSRLQSGPELERALLLLTTFANAFVWAPPEPVFRLPPPVAVPLQSIASLLGRPPLVHYASMALQNWRRLDCNAPLACDNASLLVRLSGGMDEDWFFVVTIGVELAGAPLLRSLREGADASRHSTDHDLTHRLQQIAAAIEPVRTTLLRIREWCDPHVYTLRVRPFLAGWPEPGVVYEGVSAVPCKYIGGSAAQSSLIQVLDAALGIMHPQTRTGAYLTKLRSYMPAPHRSFIEAVERTSRLRERASCGSEALRGSYNEVIHQTAEFRRAHIKIAQDYIAGPSPGSVQRGTGGTSFASFLNSVLDETLRCKL